MAADMRLLMTTMLPLSPWSGQDVLSGNGVSSTDSLLTINVTASHYNMSTLEVDEVDYQTDDTRFPAYMSLLMTLSCGLILVVGLVGNCLVPVVIWNNRDLRNSTNLFLLNLSLADILVLSISMPTVLVEIQRPDVWKLGQVMCKSLLLVSSRTLSSAP